jgi:hypothetical protein
LIHLHLVGYFCMNYIGCSTTYQTRHCFNNSKTNEDIVTKQTHTIQTHSSSFLTHSNVLLFKSRCNIFIGFRIIKEMPGSGTPCIMMNESTNIKLWHLLAQLLDGIGNTTTVHGRWCFATIRPRWAISRHHSTDHEYFIRIYYAPLLAFRCYCL